MARLFCVGECMIEVAPAAEPGLAKVGYAGDTFNTAWYARRLLPPDMAVEYVSAVGDDAQSARMVAFMEGEGIGTGSVKRRAGMAPGLYMIALEDGERSFSYWREAAAARTLAREACLPGDVGEGDVIHVSGITLAILPGADRDRLLAELADARAGGATISFDPNIRPRLWNDPAEMRVAVTRAAKGADIVLPSHDDEREAFGDASPDATADRYAALGCRAVVVKDGGGDLLVAADGARRRLAVSPIERPVDTTAAGDSFAAGVLAARMTGGDDPLAGARLGAALARLVVMGRGALVPFDPRRLLSGERA